MTAMYMYKNMAHISFSVFNIIFTKQTRLGLFLKNDFQNFTSVTVTMSSTVSVFDRSSQRCWWEQHEGPDHHQASEYVQTETEMVNFHRRLNGCGTDAVNV